MAEKDAKAYAGHTAEAVVGSRHSDFKLCSSKCPVSFQHTTEMSKSTMVKHFF